MGLPPRLNFIKQSIDLVNDIFWFAEYLPTQKIRRGQPVSLAMGNERHRTGGCLMSGLEQQQMFDRGFLKKLVCRLAQPNQSLLDDFIGVKSQKAGVHDANHRNPGDMEQMRRT